MYRDWNHDRALYAMRQKVHDITEGRAVTRRGLTDKFEAIEARDIDFKLKYYEDDGHLTDRDGKYLVRSYSTTPTLPVTVKASSWAPTRRRSQARFVLSGRL